MNRCLSQKEIDSLVDALNTLKLYADESEITADILNNQVVLTQKEIDQLIASLNTVKGIPTIKPNVNVVLSQPEIDSLIDALNSIREYDKSDALGAEMETNQAILTQEQIDRLIKKLLAMKP